MAILARLLFVKAYLAVNSAQGCGVQRVFSSLAHD
jgi:hypothetical protein